jgi:hypothetical protein
MDNKVIGNIILEGAVSVEDTMITNQNSKRVVAEGTLQDMNVENRNKRIYATKDLAPEVNGPRMQELIKSGNFKGENGHPLCDDLVRQQTIDPKLVCVKYLKVWTEGDLIRAQFCGTNNAYGQEFDDDLRCGEKPSFSLRALGGIENVNGKAYVKNIKIITWDRVIYPSHKKAYTDKIVTEATIDGAPVYENQIIVPENDPGTIYKLTSSDAKTVISRLQRESANLDMVLNTFDGIYESVQNVGKNKIMLTDRFGGKVYVNLENHVSNAIMDYCTKF